MEITRRRPVMLTKSNLRECVKYLVDVSQANSDIAKKEHGKNKSFFEGESIGYRRSANYIRDTFGL